MSFLLTHGGDRRPDWSYPFGVVLTDFAEQSLDAEQPFVALKRDIERLAA
jgi:hypothetical protein